MRRCIKTISITFLVIALFAGCTNSNNYNTAYEILDNGQVYIKLKGKRQSMVHDPGSIGNTYEDSILIPVPSSANGIIYGKDIPVKKGFYKYLGNISIQGDQLKVDLLVDNTDNKKKDGSIWNGKYILRK